MSDHSAIEWTDTTWNPVTGCTKVSPGCAHCYIERTPPFRMSGRRFVKGTIPLEFYPDRLTQPLHWRKPRRVFVDSLSDLFHEDVPDTYIDRVFAVMAIAYWHRFQVLTKRPQRMRQYLGQTRGPDNVLVRVLRQARKVQKPSWYRHLDSLGWPYRNVDVGVTAENQRFYESRVWELLNVPAARRFLSLEPLLGPIDLQLPGLALSSDHGAFDGWIDWVIVGGESGPHARACDLQWARSVVQQCGAAGVPVFVKQLGSNPVQRVLYGRATFEPDQPVHREPLRLRQREGRDMAEWPEDLRVRELPAEVAS